MWLTGSEGYWGLAVYCHAVGTGKMHMSDEWSPKSLSPYHTIVPLYLTPPPTPPPLQPIHTPTPKGLQTSIILNPHIILMIRILHLQVECICNLIWCTMMDLSFFFNILRKSLHWKPSWRMPKKNCSQLKQRLRSVSFACCCLQSYCFIIVFLLSFIDYAISQQVPIQLYNNAWISSSNNSIWYKISVLSKVYFYTLWVS